MTGVGFADQASGRRYHYLLLLSLVLHLVLTPVVGWIGFVSSFLAGLEAAESASEEQFEEIPIELFEVAEDDSPALPENDPIAFIEEVVVPERPPAEQREEPPVSKPAPVASAASKPAPTATDSADQDAGAPPAKPSPSSSKDEAKSVEEAPEPKHPPRQQPAKKDGAPRSPRRPIRNPLAFHGEAAKVVREKAYVGMVLHLDRLRQHKAARRVAEILPRLPQWRDFFRAGSIDPIRDFDRIHVVGPSFYNSRSLIAHIEFNVPVGRVRGAIDALVQREGEWIKAAPYLTARARADRALRSFIIREPNLVQIVPPEQEAAMLKLKRPGVEAAEGGEVLVARTELPHKPFARLGISVPESVKWATVRLTPIGDSAVRVELEALDASKEQALETARAMSQSINSGVEMISGLSSLLSQFGIGSGTRLPQVLLSSDGPKIVGEVVLDETQIDFLLTRIERQLIGAEMRAPRTSGQDRPQARPSATGRRPVAKPPRQSAAP